jgi:hypothetical protein
VKEVAVAGGAEATVEDLVRALQAQMAAEGTPVKLPSEGELYAGDTARAALASYPFAPQLCLTLVRPGPARVLSRDCACAPAYHQTSIPSNHGMEHTIPWFDDGR